MDSSATDSGTEDVLSSQMLSGPLHHTMSRNERQPRQYKTKSMVTDGDWLTQRNVHQNKVMVLFGWKFLSWCRHSDVVQAVQ